jgi:hypothetical protein
MIAPSGLELAAALLVGQLAALLVGYYARPSIDRWRLDRRWKSHVNRCARCYPVFRSFGPRWLYCSEGRRLGEALSGERWTSLADMLRESDGIPTARDRDVC